MTLKNSLEDRMILKQSRRQDDSENSLENRMILDSKDTV